MDPTAYRRVVEILEEHTGANIARQRARLQPLFQAARRRGFATAKAYVEHLEGHVTEELPFLLDLGLVHVTSFARDATFWNGVQAHVFAKLAPSASFRVLSLGCSTGAELATVTLLAAARLERPELLEVDAWDIAPATVERARQLTFERRRLTRLPLAVPAELLEPDPKIRRNVRLIEALRERVTVRVGDVRHMIGDWWGHALGAYDLILCRNLLTYLDEKAVAEIWPSIWTTGKRNGFLGIGSVDPLPPATLFEQVSPLLYRLTAPR